MAGTPALRPTAKRFSPILHQLNSAEDAMPPLLRWHINPTKKHHAQIGWLAHNRERAPYCSENRYTDFSSQSLGERVMDPRAQIELMPGV